MMAEATGTTATLENVIETLAAQNTSAFISAFTALPTANLQTNIKGTPLSVTLTTTSSSITSGIAGTGNVSLTATVTGFAGTPIADNTTVTFAVVSGSGTLSAASALTAGGTATVTISSTVVGTVGVTATAGTAVSSPLKVPFAANPEDPGKVTLNSSATSAVVGNSMTLTANVGVVGGGTVAAGSPAPDGTIVTFAIVHGSGTLTSGAGTSTGSVTATTTNGNAAVTLTSATAGNITLSASAGASPPVTSNPVTVTFTPNPAAPAKVTVSASSTSEPADGSTPITFTIAVTNYLGAALPNVPLTISTNAGTLSATTATTDANGNATVTLTSSTVGTATVTVSATAAGVTATGTAQVSFTKPPPRPTTAIVTVFTSGTLASGTKIGGIQATLTYPTNLGLGVSTTSPPVASGVGSGTNFFANSSNPGYVIFDLSTTTGITTGAFATITFTIPTSGTLPVSGDFAIASAANGVQGVTAPIVDDTNANALSGITVFETVTFQ